MRVVAIIQARISSTRLPGKVLKDIGGQSMLAQVVRRTQQATLVDQVVVATTGNSADDAIVAECVRLNVPAFRGDEEDVLDRTYQAAAAHKAEAVVRITSDCPLIEPEVVDRVVNAFLKIRPDYASICLERTYPRGLDVEVMTCAALECAWREAQEPYQRVHVTPYIYQHPHKFGLLSVTNDTNYAKYRWTVDTQEDLDFVREVYDRLDSCDGINWTQVLNLLARAPELLQMNRAIRQKALSEG
jgi:spore coat polysaccharide biosynthesis protein SpsF